MFKKLFNKIRKSVRIRKMNWEILVSIPMTVHTAVTHLIGKNELILVDVRTGFKKTVAKSNVFQDDILRDIQIEGIGSEKDMPILYINAEDYNYRM